MIKRTEHLSRWLSVCNAVHNRGVQKFGSYGERAWYAWHCLTERDKFGGPVAMRALERREKELNPGELNRFVHGEYAEPSWRVATRVARLLGVDPDWLMDGVGAGPATPWNVSVPPWPGPRESAPKRVGRRNRAADVAADGSYPSATGETASALKDLSRLPRAVRGKNQAPRQLPAPSKKRGSR